MLKFGMPTLIETKTTQECAALCHELGLDFIEINMNLPQYQTDTMDVPLLKEMAQRYGISYTVHLDENMNVCDFNTSVSEAYREMVVESIGLAKQLNIPVLNMHLNYGVFFTLPDRKVYLFEEYKSDYLKKMKQFRDRCEEAIGDSGIKICTENYKGYSPAQVEALDLLLESDAFGLTYDVGHNYCQNGCDEPIILARDTRLHHMHLHDVLPGGKDHQALGTGDMDIMRCLNIAKDHNCSVVVETKNISGLRESIRWLDENWRSKEA